MSVGVSLNRKSPPCPAAHKLAAWRFSETSSVSSISSNFSSVTALQFHNPNTSANKHKKRKGADSSLDKGIKGIRRSYQPWIRVDWAFLDRQADRFEQRKKRRSAPKTYEMKLKTKPNTIPAMYVRLRSGHKLNSNSKACSSVTNQREKGS